MASTLQGHFEALSQEVTAKLTSSETTTEDKRHHLANLRKKCDGVLQIICRDVVRDPHQVVALRQAVRDVQAQLDAYEKKLDFDDLAAAENRPNLATETELERNQRWDREAEEAARTGFMRARTFISTEIAALRAEMEMESQKIAEAAVVPEPIVVPKAVKRKSHVEAMKLEEDSDTEAEMKQFRAAFGHRLGPAWEWKPTLSQVLNLKPVELLPPEVVVMSQTIQDVTKYIAMDRRKFIARDLKAIDATASYCQLVTKGVPIQPFVELWSGATEAHVACIIASLRGYLAERLNCYIASVQVLYSDKGMSVSDSEAVDLDQTKIQKADTSLAFDPAAIFYATKHTPKDPKASIACEKRPSLGLAEGDRPKGSYCLHFRLEYDRVFATFADWALFLMSITHEIYHNAKLEGVPIEAQNQQELLEVAQKQPILAINPMAFVQNMKIRLAGTKSVKLITKATALDPALKEQLQSSPDLDPDSCPLKECWISQDVIIEPNMDLGPYEVELPRVVEFRPKVQTRVQIVPDNFHDDGVALPTVQELRDSQSKYQPWMPGNSQKKQSIVRGRMQRMEKLHAKATPKPEPMTLDKLKQVKLQRWPAPEAPISPTRVEDPSGHQKAIKTQLKEQKQYGAKLLLRYHQTQEQDLMHEAEIESTKYFEEFPIKELKRETASTIQLKAKQAEDVSIATKLERASSFVRKHRDRLSYLMNLSFDDWKEYETTRAERERLDLEDDLEATSFCE